MDTMRVTSAVTADTMNRHDTAQRTRGFMLRCAWLLSLRHDG
jgi:hypothetical protein